MIESNQLRLGNWVYAPKAFILPEMKTSEFNDLMPYQIVFISDNSGHCIFYEPIPLTPEILEKLDKIECGPFTMQASNIEYVHQLQNLYFALTGEELNIELTNKTPA